MNYHHHTFYTYICVQGHRKIYFTICICKSILPTNVSVKQLSDIKKLIVISNLTGCQNQFYKVDCVQIENRNNYHLSILKIVFTILQTTYIIIIYNMTFVPTTLFIKLVAYWNILYIAYNITIILSLTFIIELSTTYSVLVL